MQPSFRGAVLRTAALLLTLCASGFSSALHAELVSATLPSSRSVQVDAPATVFGTMINAGDTELENCGVSVESPFAGSFSYQTTDPATNTPNGTPDTPVSLGPGAAQSFVLSLLPSAAVADVELSFRFACEGSTAASVSGLNTLRFSASTTPVPDVIALAAADAGVARIPSATGVGAFAVATINLGSTDNISVMADTGAAQLPVDVLMCQTNAQAQCINPTEPAVGPMTIAMDGGAPATFSFFPYSTEEIPFDPAKNRVFVRFEDSTGVTRGATSVAAEMPRLVQAASDKARVTRRNLPMFALWLNHIQYLSATAIENRVRQEFGGDFPALTLNDRADTENCAQGGTFTRTVRGSGAEIEHAWSNCQSSSSSSRDGSLTMLIGDIDPAAGSYTVSIIYDQLQRVSGESVSLYQGGISAINVVDYDNNEATHDVTIESLSLSRGTVDNPAEQTFSATNLEFTTLRGLGYSNGALADVSGDIAIGGDGYVTLDSSPDPEGKIISISGAPGTTQSFAFDRETATLSYQPAGELVYQQTASSYQLDGSFLAIGENEPPQWQYFYVDQELLVGESFTLDFSMAFWDANLDFVSTRLSIVLGDADALQINRLSNSSYSVTALATGTYRFAATGSDYTGQSNTNSFDLFIDGDTDGDGDNDRYDSDDDNDGVRDEDDAFPLDASESRDSDNDGVGDNADTDDDNDGVQDSEDAFPFDAECSTLQDSTCALRALSNYDVALNTSNSTAVFVIYTENRLYRWDTSNNSLADVVEVRTAVPSDSMLSSAAWVPSHGRLYLGYSNGAITYVADGATEEVYFAAVSQGVSVLANAGNYLIVEDGNYNANLHSFGVDGQLAATHSRWYSRSDTFAYSSLTNHLYHFRDGSSPNDIYWTIVDQSSGEFTESLESPYHGDYSIAPPIVISPTGDRVLTGGGSIYNDADLNWLAALAGDIKAADWSSAHSIITLRERDGNTELTQRGDALQLYDRRSFVGVPRGLLTSPTGYLVLTEIDGALAATPYLPGADTDGDSVAYINDAFPLDIAASLDSDNDGAPDQWNSGYTADDSTTGLVLDAFPLNSACQLAEQAINGVCDIESSIPAYSPDAIDTSAAGVVYLFSEVNNRVYRYDSASASNLSPLIVGTEFERPTLMEYHPGHNRLYFGYDSGAITFINLSEATAQQEREFVTMDGQVEGLGAAGEFLLAQDPSGAWVSHYIFAENGALADSAEWNYRSPDYAWNPVSRRVFYIGSGDLMYEELSAAGEITADGEQSYNSNYSPAAPLIISPDGTKVLMGSGDIANADDLSWVASLLNDFVDGVFTTETDLLTVRAFSNMSRLEVYADTNIWQSETDYPGTPLALEKLSAGVLLVATQDGKPTFTLIE